MMSLAGSLSATMPEVILLVGLLLIVGLRIFRPRMRLFAPYFGAAAALMAAVQAAAQIGGPQVTAFHDALRIDLWSALARILVYASTGAALLLIVAPLKTRDATDRDARRAADRTILFLAAGLGAAILAASQDLLVTVLGLELVVVAITLAVRAEGDHATAAAAGKTFFASAAATAMMLLGMAFLFAERGHVRLAPFDATNARLMIGWALTAAGLFFQAGVAPFHAVPADLRRSASPPVAALLAGVVQVGAVAALGRFVFWSQPGTPEMVKSVIALAATSLFLGNAAALRERALGRFFAVSLIAHAGLLLTGAAATLHSRNPTGLGALLFTLAAAAPALLAFAVVSGRRPPEAGRTVECLRGFWRADPLAAAALTVVLLSLAGLPITLGFQARLGILAASLQAGQVGLFGVVAIAVFLAAAAHLRIIGEIFSEPAAPWPPLLTSGERALLCAVAIYLLVTGLFPDLLLRLTAAAALGLMP